MHDLTPEFISQMATRIYNEPPGANGMPHEGTTPPPAADIEAAHEPGSLPAGTPSPSLPSRPPVSGYPAEFTPLPTSLSTGVPVSPLLGGIPTSAPDGVLASPSSSLPSGLPTGITSGLPAALPSAENASLPQGAPADGEGLRAFVQQIRTTHVQPDTGLTITGSQPPSHPSLDRGMGARAFDPAVIRRDFPVLNQEINGKPLVWLDNAATTQKPQCVIDALSNYYAHDNSNIHRGAHTLAARSTDAYEGAREKVQKFLGASAPQEIVFVRGTTEGINLVAQTYGKKFLQPGDEIVLSTLEHHANIVPWQMIAREKGAVLRVIPVNDRGEVKLEEYQSLLGPRTKIVSLAHASNSLGTILPIGEMIQLAKRYNARVLMDGAQSVAHLPVNVQQLDCDFFVFSGHKIFAPTGIGAVFAKQELLELIPPWQGGGSMIRDVTFEETVYSPPPAKFEAGTPSVGDAVGLGAALDYVNRLGLENIGKYEHELLEYATHRLSQIPGLRLIGTAREKVGVLSFVLPDKRPEDVGRLLDLEGIAVRAGHHCAQPSLRRFGLEKTVRPSLALYNTKDDIDRLVDAIRRIQRM